MRKPLIIFNKISRRYYLISPPSIKTIWLFAYQRVAIFSMLAGTLTISPEISLISLNSAAFILKAVSITTRTVKIFLILFLCKIYIFIFNLQIIYTITLICNLSIIYFYNLIRIWQRNEIWLIFLKFECRFRKKFSVQKVSLLDQIYYRVTTTSSLISTLIVEPVAVYVL